MYRQHTQYLGYCRLSNWAQFCRSKILKPKLQALQQTTRISDYPWKVMSREKYLYVCYYRSCTRGGRTQLTFDRWVANEGTLRGALITLLAHDQLVVHVVRSNSTSKGQPCLTLFDLVPPSLGTRHQGPYRSSLTSVVLNMSAEFALLCLGATLLLFIQRIIPFILLYAI